MHTKKHRLNRLRKLHRKTKHKGGIWPFSSSSSKVSNDKNVIEADNKNTVITFLTENISIQSIPNNYKSIGILHLTESSGINALRSMGTDVANIFGSKGFDNGVYDHLRKTTFERVKTTLTPGQKVFNMRLDFETNPQGSTIFLHLYGDLCKLIQKKNNDGR